MKKQLMSKLLRQEVQTIFLLLSSADSSMINCLT